MQSTELSTIKQVLDKDGFAVIEDVFTNDEITEITERINAARKTSNEPTLPKEYAVRKIFSSFPGLKEKLFNDNIKLIVRTIFGCNHFLVKGLYFNKPPLSNWFVAYHQDISIAVSEKIDADFYKNWTKKDEAFGVQPPVEVLKSMYTIRIHLDDCTVENGALHVIPGSHMQGIYPSQSMHQSEKVEVICSVPSGGIMLMRPLLLHASHKSVSLSNRRVLHLEFSDTNLPGNLNWAEKQSIF